MHQEAMHFRTTHNCTQCAQGPPIVNYCRSCNLMTMNNQKYCAEYGCTLTIAHNGSTLFVLKDPRSTVPLLFIVDHVT